MGTRIVPADAVLVTTTTTNTGTYSLGSAMTGFFHPNDLSLNGARVSYTAVDSLDAPTIREIGEGVLTSGSPWTLTRATIRRSLTGGVAGTSAINWAAGTKYLFLTPVAANLSQFDTDGWLHTASDLVLATNGTERARVSSSGAWTFADAAAARAGLVTPPTPKAGAGVGEWVFIVATIGSALTLPAGGTWMWFTFSINGTGNVTGANAGGPTAGGSTLASAVPGTGWYGFAWRIT